MNRLRGLLAVALIVGLLVGTPLVLFALGANPLAAGVPAWSDVVRALTVPDDGRLLLGLLKVAAWVAWLLLAVLLLVEIVAQLRGIKAPTLPGFKAPQGLIRSLVATAALAFVAMPMATAVAAADPAPAPAKTVVQQVDHHAKQAPAKKGQAAAGSTHRVKAGDTLWELAEDHLGDGNRYPEIFKASKSIAQPGGAHLTDPDVIDVGWKVRIPDQKAHKDNKVDRPKAEVAPRTPVQPTAPAPVQPTAPATQQQNAPAASSASAEAEHLAEDSAWMVQTAAGVGTILAAGVIGLLARRRRTQQQHRRPGTKLPMPVGQVAAAEQELRAAADSLSVELVDQALRTLAHTCRHTSTPLPDVRAARLTAAAFDLYLSEPAQLPAPWADQLEGTVWSITVDDTHDLPRVDLADIPAPYPALVTIGHDDEEGHVLLNLEHLGGLGVTGDSLATREVLAALAVELSTSIWADDLTVTVVAAFAELEDSLRTGRIRYVPSVSRVLDDLQARAAADRAALASSGSPNLNSARAAGVLPDAWVPEIVIIGGELTERQHAQLAEIVDVLPRVAIAAVTSSDSLAGEWRLILPTDPATSSEAILEPIGLPVVPQRLPAAEYGHLLEIAALADIEEIDQDGSTMEPDLAEVDAVTPVDEPAEHASSMPVIVDETAEAYVARPLPASLREALAEDDTQTVDHAATEDTTPEAEPTIAQDDPADEYLVDVDATTASPADEPAVAASVAVEEPAAPAAAVGVRDEGAPRILVLGPVSLANVGGTVEKTRAARLLEFAAYLALHPGATYQAIDDAIWPDRRTEDNTNTRNPATTKLRRWVGTAPDGHEYLPRHQSGGGYGFTEQVTTDVADWDALIQGDPLSASTANLEAAFRLLRGLPFEGVHARRYAWAEPLRQRLISDIVDVSHELTRRRLLEGRWRAAEEAVVVGLRVEPAQESLWRLRILAAHESRNAAAVAEAIDRLLVLTEQLECDLEPETTSLLEALRTHHDDDLMAKAL